MVRAYGTLAIVALVLTGCQNSAPTQSGLEGMEHVHGMGVNPADERLYIATHFGMWRMTVDGGDTERITDSLQDTMGFTVAGPDHFYGSGHPDLEDPVLNQPPQPPLLGLIESTDAGRTWQSRSLLHEADFHGLTFAHDTLYAADSTNRRFMVSSDEIDWEERAAIGCQDVDVSPTDPDLLVGICDSDDVAYGVYISRDGGASWSATAAPILRTTTWQDDTELWGASDDGGIHVSADDGVSWEGRGVLPGAVTALFDAGSWLFAAVIDDGIYRSDDAAATWHRIYAEPR